MNDDSKAALAELSQAIAADILTLPELRDPDWDAYSMVAEVTDFSVKMVAYRYSEAGPPVPTPGPANSYAFIQLRDRTRGIGGETWDVALAKIHRDSANLVMNSVSGEAAELWRVTPGNLAHLRESLRPRPQDFQPL